MKKFIFYSLFSFTFIFITISGYSQKTLQVKCDWCGASIKVKKSKDNAWSDEKKTYYKYDYLNGFACGGGFADYSKLVREFGYFFDIENFIKGNSFCTKKCYYNAR
jgi:hypothetical protein